MKNGEDPNGKMEVLCWDKNCQIEISFYFCGFYPFLDGINLKAVVHLHDDCLSLSLCHPYLFYLFCLFLLSLIYILLFNKTSYILIKKDCAGLGNLKGTQHIDIGATQELINVGSKKSLVSVYNFFHNYLYNRL